MKDRAFLIRDVLGLDFASTGLKAVRVKAGTDKVSVVDAEVIPFDIEGGDAEASDRRESRPFSIPKRLQARSVALTCTAKDALVKMLTINGSTGPGTDARIFKEMALENAKNYRLAYKVTQRERTGFTVVAAAFSESLADKLLGFFSSGIPAPVTLEISGFSAMTAFLRGAGRSFAEDSIGVVDFGYTTTTFVMYAKGVPVLIRRFSFGLETMQKRIVAQLHIDPITAVAMLSHPGFDLAPILQPVLAPIAKQLAISRGFVERKTGQGIRSIHIGGALAGVAGVRSWLERDVGLSVETWDPLDALSEPAEALPDVLVEAPWRFAAAIGVALGVMHT